MVDMFAIHNTWSNQENLLSWIHFDWVLSEPKSTIRVLTFVLLSRGTRSIRVCRRAVYLFETLAVTSLSDGPHLPLPRARNKSLWYFSRMNARQEKTRRFLVVPAAFLQPNNRLLWSHPVLDWPPILRASHNPWSANAPGSICAGKTGKFGTTLAAFPGVWILLRYSQTERGVFRNIIAYDESTWRFILKVDGENGVNLGQ